MIPQDARDDEVVAAFGGAADFAAREKTVVVVRFER